MSLRRDLVPIPSSFSLENWNHFGLRRGLVPILSSFALENWNHFGPLHDLVPIPFCFQNLKYFIMNTPAIIIPAPNRIRDTPGETPSFI